MPLNWQYLSPQEFQQLQEYTSYSTKRLQDVLRDFQIGGRLDGFDPEKPIDYASFRVFMLEYLDTRESNFPEDLCRHLFLSFMRRPSTSGEETLPNPSQFGGTVPSAVTKTVSSTILGPIVDASSLSDRLTQLEVRRGPSSSRSHPQLSIAHEDVETTTETPNHSRSSSKKSAHSVHSLHHATHTGNRIEVTGQSEVWKRQSHSSLLHNITNKSNGQALPLKEMDVSQGSIELKDLVCYLSLLEAGRPEDKLEFVFRLYDTDSNGCLDAAEVECIVNQMMTVAEYLGWDTTELKPILQDMMKDIDYDDDGIVSLDEWKRGGLTTIPLLVLLGLDTNVKDDGTHVWRMKHFAKSAHCNRCLKQLIGLGKQGLSCIYCKYTVHERCVAQAPASCIYTYTKSKKAVQPMQHHWVEGNTVEKCTKCKKSIKSGIHGLQCRWCQVTLHNKCAEQWSTECDFGELKDHILPPSCIFPAVLERKSTTVRPRKDSSDISSVMEENGAGGDSTGLPSPGSSSQLQSMADTSSSFQIVLPPALHPLLVFINPKSGGKQGVRLLKKFKYLLNPRQVYDIMRDCGPMQGLQFFKDIRDFRILICGGDGTIGWLLEAMDKFDWGEFRPPVSILPLGTGNDLARCLRWGGGYEGENLIKVLRRVSDGTVVMLDRWKIEFSEPVANANGTEDEEEDTEEAEEAKKGDEIPCNIINNYFSIGVDASIAHRFHIMREKHPEKFSSRMRNKMFYFEVGTSEFFESECKNLHEHLDIICDGVALDLSSGPSLEGIALLNIPSVYGGATLWGGTPGQKKRQKKQQKRKKNEREKDGSTSSMNSAELAFTVQDMGDQLIEVVGLENVLHVGLVGGGLKNSGKRLAQCSEVVIRTRKRFPMQIDGEPWMQPACTISITHMNQVPMIMGPPSNKRGGFLGLFSKS